MGIVIFIIVLGALAFLGYNIYSCDNGTKDTPSKLNLNFESEGRLHERFKEAYLWSCKVFGVSENVYDNLEDELRAYPSLGIGYFVYYYASRYPRKYPRMVRCQTLITDYCYKDSKKIREFANEFINIVNSVRKKVDEEEIVLFNKYDIPFKHLLTEAFEVDNMKLYSLPS